MRQPDASWHPPGPGLLRVRLPEGRVQRTPAVGGHHGRRTCPPAPRTDPISNLDGATLRALTDRGADLGRSRQTVHYLCFAKRQGAQPAAQALATESRIVKVHQSRAQWAVVLSQTMIVTPAMIDASRREFEAVAERFGGDYDGWEAAVD
jgi:hypothetical protein